MELGIPLASCLLVTAFGTSAAARADESDFYGLLRSRDLTPFGFLRLHMRPAHAVAIEPGTWAFEAELGYQNTWSLSSEVEKYLTSLEAQGRRDIGPAVEEQRCGGAVPPQSRFSSVFLMVRIFRSFKKPLRNSTLPRGIASSLSANFSLKLELDLNPRNMQVGSTASHREAGRRPRSRISTHPGYGPTKS